MDEKNIRIAELLFREIIGKITSEEREELQRWRDEKAGNELLYAEMKDLHMLEEEYRLMKSVNTERPMRAFMEMQSRRRREKVRPLLRWASVLTVLIGLSSVFFFMNQSHENEVKILADQPVSIEKLVGSTKATLTTASGEVINLGDNKQTNDRLLASIGTNVDEAKKIMLNVPRGGEFKIELEDGTEVWLNSESQLTYPEHFGEEERKVSVTGEAFFKVKRDVNRPFYVETDGQVVKVLGTEFNVKSYSEDGDVQTTLVSGSIALSRKGDESKQLMLTPGHQSVFDKKELSVQLKTIDTDIVTSWRNGQFVFEHQNLQQIMKVLSRWYTFDYYFADSDVAKMEFMGSIPRYSNLGTALTILEKSGNLRFSIRGNKVEISKRKRR